MLTAVSAATAMAASAERDAGLVQDDSIGIAEDANSIDWTNIDSWKHGLDFNSPLV
jgi:hypothetical protein